MPEVVALGEALIDFSPLCASAAGNPVFERNPGGAPANVLSMLSKLGISTEFIGKVGNDMFGRELKQILEKAGIGTRGLILSKEYNTTLAFVELNKKGDRSFGFVRNYGADKMLTPGEVDFSLLDGAKLFHFGGVSLTEEPDRSAALEAAKEAKRRGITVSYDPNFRAPLWKDDNPGKILLEGVKLADILKVSDEECRMLSGTDDIARGAEYLGKTYGPRLVFVTLGANGSAFSFGGRFITQRTFDVRTIDTTGAGDAFFGAVLYRLLRSGKKLRDCGADEIDGYMRFANAAGSLVTAKKGAIMSMPGIEQINDLLEHGELL